MDLLKDIHPILRRWIRVLVAFGLSGVVSGLVIGLQEVVLPELRGLLGSEIYELLQVTLFGSLIASLQAGSKWLRNNREVYLPF